MNNCFTLECCYLVKNNCNLLESDLKMVMKLVCYSLLTANV